MPKVFIVRPFGVRQVLKKIKNSADTETLYFDFEKVESELIRPAMQELGLWGGTTGEVFAAGSIMEDMFSELLLADIVIADITIHNANVFYELGIRHALRDKKTILIKCSGFDDTPFDINGFRYLTYNKDNPAADNDDPKGTCKKLVITIKETIASDRNDSPVFNILPLLKPQDATVYSMTLPIDFLNELEEAISAKDIGKIVLMDYEINDSIWKTAGRRRIGQALLWNFELYELASPVMEKICQEYPADVQANDWLSTIYQRLGSTSTDLTVRNSLLDRSDRAIDKLLAQKGNLSQYKQAEVYALKARNIKTRWIKKWQEKLEKEQRQKEALCSDYILDSFDNYKHAFESDLNHYYSGINAIGLVVIYIELAKIHPITWCSLFSDEEEASSKLRDYERMLEDLFILVNQSIETEIKRVELLIKVEFDRNVKNKLVERLTWAKISRADLYFLKSSEKTPLDSIVMKYKKSVDTSIQRFNLSSAMAQIRLFFQLGIKEKMADNVIEEFENQVDKNVKPIYTILFTGHMIDKPDRSKPRFPESKESNVRQLIKNKILEEKEKKGKENTLVGIAGGACGSDILFHEVCEELEIPTTMFLALPREIFLVESVAFAGLKWQERFDDLYKKLPHPVLSQTKELPKWLAKKKDYDIWSRNNLWELNNALVHGGANTTLIYLWDGQDGDGPGGTKHMVDEAKAKGAKLNPIDMNLV